MNIYPSTKAAPYVYRLDHPVTGEFYVGYRSANKTPSDQDILKYRTSSKYVKPRFDEFICTILAEFNDALDAYWFEQELIKSTWKHPLSLNKNYKSTNDGKKFISPTGRVPWNKGIHTTAGTFKKGFTPWNKGLTASTDTRVKNNGISTSKSRTGKKFSPNTPSHLEKRMAARKETNSALCSCRYCHREGAWGSIQTHLRYCKLI